LKTAYLNAITNDLISNHGYMPIKNGDRFTLYDNYRGFEKRGLLNYVILELVDVDQMSSESFRDFAKRKLEWLSSIRSINLHEHIVLLQVYLFSQKPREEEMKVIDFLLSHAHNESPIEIIVVDFDSGEVYDLTHLKNVGRDILTTLNNYIKSDLSNFHRLTDVESMINIETPAQPLKKVSNISPATYTIIGINIFIWVLGRILLRMNGLDSTIIFGIKINQLILQGEYWRLITPMFLHADIMHLFANSFSLYLFGEAIEHIMGTGKFILIYLLSGLLGNVVSFAFSANPSLGASGAVLGVGGALVYVWLKNKDAFRSSQRQYLSLVFMAIFNVFYGFSKPNIDNFAHVGGFIGGFLLSAAFYKSTDSIP